MILSYGMGVDSTAILLNWIENPASRAFRVYDVVEGVDPPTFTYRGSGSFDLKDLTIVTAMTGDEFPDLKRLIEKHIFPRLRQHGIRYVQVARKSKTEPMTLLEDSRSPRTLHLDGAYKLSDELLGAGTVPQVAGSRRLCSIKSKGWPLDAWIEQEVQGQPFVQAIGFNAEEGRRVTRDQSYSAIKWPVGQKTSIYPLMHDWSWGRQACEDYIQSVTGEVWPKSACAYCPFAAGKEPVLVRFEEFPEQAAFSLFIEYVSMALNPRMTLYSTKSLMSVVQGVGDRDALKLFGKMMDRAPWAIYRVRRIYTQKAHADRSVTIIEEGKRSAIEKRLPSYGQVSQEGGIPRVYVIRRTEDVYPTLEEMFVAAPRTMQDKERPRFPGNWDRAIKGDWSFMRSHAVEIEEDEAEEPVVPELSGPREEPRLFLWDHDPSEYHEHPLRLEQKAWEKELADLIPLP
jgi:hypothetical protein